MMWGYDWGLGALMMILFWVFLIAGGVWLALSLGRGAGTMTNGRGSARRILEERLARGEIDVEEYRARLKALEEGSR